MTAPPRVRRILMTADAVGGVWTYACELIPALRREGVATDLVILGPPPPDYELRRAETCGAMSVHVLPGKLEWMPDPWRDVEEAGDCLVALANRTGADVVHLNGFCHAAWPFRSPVVVVGHSCVCSWFWSVRGCDAPGDYDLYRQFVSRGLRSAAAVTAPSAAMLRCLRRHYGAFNGTEPIHNALHLDATPRKEKQRIVMTAGRLWDEAKNVAALDRIAPRISWPIVAAGPYESPESKRAEFRELLLLGPLSHDRLLAELAAASIYAHPARYEPFGLSVLEAANAGCALVLSEIATMRELWDGAAIFVPVDDDDALLEALEMLMEDGLLRTEMAAAARARALSFQPEIQARAYVELYEQALAASHALLHAEAPAARGVQ